MRSPFRPARGFTLVELLIGVVVATLTMAAAITLLIAQKRAFQGSSADRAEQEAGRMALEHISDNLRQAAYGIEPPMVFDFGYMANVPMDRAPAGGVPVNFGGDASGKSGFPCATPVTCRDSIVQPDELAFQYRDPYFNRPLAAATPNSLTISLLNPITAAAQPLTQPIPAGQVLQVVCYSGDMVWAYVTVSQTVNPAAGATVTIPLQAGSNLDYPHQNQTLTDTCFNSGQAAVFKVNRFHYFVQSYDVNGNVVPWETPGSRPYLMLDQGLLDANNNAVLNVVAPDVEDLQVSYVVPLAAAGAQLLGSTPNVQLTNSAGGIDLAPALGPPVYSTPSLSPLRATGYPANIRAVGVTLVVRSPNPDPNSSDPTVPAAGNRPVSLNGQPGYRRMLFETSVAVPNMASAAPYFPAIGNGADQLNVGGG
ncbi:MAG TPA: PilW family protein [Anaeromyxobacteraceae bacterium]|nr:PilW family protein [Anaeromyxobacteraceae bacterium]